MVFTTSPAVTPVVCSARARHTVSPRPRTPPTPGMPHRRLAARTFACRPASARVLSPDPVTTPGCPVLGE
eukprot:1745163-Prymnesium_polylepis.1